MRLSAIDLRLPQIEARQRELTKMMWSAMLPEEKDVLNREYQDLHFEKTHLLKARDRMIRAGIHG